VYEDFTVRDLANEKRVSLTHNKIWRIAGGVPKLDRFGIQPGDIHLKSGLFLGGYEFPDSISENRYAFFRQGLPDPSKNNE
jgi:hypothetical protein